MKRIHKLVYSYPLLFGPALIFLMSAQKKECTGTAGSTFTRVITHQAASANGDSVWAVTEKDNGHCAALPMPIPILANRVPSHAVQAAYSSDGAGERKVLFVALRDENRVLAFEGTQLIGAIPTGRGPFRVRLDGRHSGFILNRDEGSITKFDVATLLAQTSPPVAALADPTAMSFGGYAGNNVLTVANQGNSNVVLLSPASLQAIGQVGIGPGAKVIAPYPDNGVIWVAHPSGSALHLLDLNRLWAGTGPASIGGTTPLPGTPVGEPGGTAIGHSIHVAAGAPGTLTPVDAESGAVDAARVFAGEPHYLRFTPVPYDSWIGLLKNPDAFQCSDESKTVPVAPNAVTVEDEVPLTDGANLALFSTNRLTALIGPGGTAQITSPNPAPANGVYPAGANVIINATPNAGRGLRVAGADSVTGNQIQLTMNGPRGLVIDFPVLATRNLTITQTPANQGAVDPPPPGRTYQEGALATITASHPVAGAPIVFTGADSTTATTANVNVTSDRTVNVEFASAKGITLTATKNGPGGPPLTSFFVGMSLTGAGILLGQGAPPQVSHVATTGNPVVTVLTNTANAPGCSFVNFTSNPARPIAPVAPSGTFQRAQVTLDGAAYTSTVVTANYDCPATPSTFRLTVNQTGTGSFVSSPAASNNDYAPGTVVTITATPNPTTLATVFDGVDAINRAALTATVTMNANRTVGVTFTAAPSSRFVVGFIKTGANAATTANPCTGLTALPGTCAPAGGTTGLTLIPRSAATATTTRNLAGCAFTGWTLAPDVDAASKSTSQTTSLERITINTTAQTTNVTANYNCP